MTAVPASAVTADQVLSAAGWVALSLSEAEATEVAALLSNWIPAATALNTRMQAVDLTALTPITVFTTPDDARSAPPSPE